MANYGRNGGNVSQFMREHLNTVHTNEPQEDFSFETDLDLFTNTSFVDFDTGVQTDFSQPAPKPGSASPTSSKAEPQSATSTMMGEFGSMDFINSGKDKTPFFHCSFPCSFFGYLRDRNGGVLPPCVSAYV